MHSLLGGVTRCSFIHCLNQWRIDFLRKIKRRSKYVYLFLYLCINGYVYGLWQNQERGGFPGGSVIKNLPAMQKARVWSLGWGRPPGEGNGNPLQYFSLENPHGQRSLVGYSPCGCKESDTEMIKQQQQDRRKGPMKRERGVSMTKAVRLNLFFLFLVALTRSWLWVAEALLLWVLILWYFSQVWHMTNTSLLVTRRIAEEDFWWGAFTYSEKVSTAHQHGQGSQGHWPRFLGSTVEAGASNPSLVRAGNSVLPPFFFLLIIHSFPFKHFIFRFWELLPTLTPINQMLRNSTVFSSQNEIYSSEQL